MSRSPRTAHAQIDARRDAVVSAVASGNSESLLAQDQLLKNLATNQTFRLRSFKEPAIRFPPTYKCVTAVDLAARQEADSSPRRAGTTRGRISTTRAASGASRRGATVCCTAPTAPTRSRHCTTSATRSMCLSASPFASSRSSGDDADKRCLNVQSPPHLGRVRPPGQTDQLGQARRRVERGRERVVLGRERDHR